MKKLFSFRSTLFFFLWFLQLPFASSFAAPLTYSVCAWNVENFGLASHHRRGSGELYNEMKPEKEIAAVMAILKKLNPDILGVNEIIQDPHDQYLQLFRSRLKEAGLDYPYYTTVRGEDSRIQNLFLSRFPIVKDESINTPDFEVTKYSRSTGESYPMKMRMERGLIHCVLQISPTYQLQVMLVHLKSRIPVASIEGAGHERGDEAIRHGEAAIVRSAIDAVLTADPKAKLIVMGDMNDSLKSKTLQTMMGDVGADHLTELNLKDYLGDVWTHYYDFDLTYSRIDHMLVNENLLLDFIGEKSFIYRMQPGDPPELNSYNASDHRPLYAVFSVESP